MLLILRRILTSPSLTVISFGVFLVIRISIYTGVFRYPTIVATTDLNSVTFIEALTSNYVHAYVWHIHPIAGIVFSFVYSFIYIVNTIIIGLLLYVIEHRQLPK